MQSNLLRQAVDALLGDDLTVVTGREQEVAEALSGVLVKHGYDATPDQVLVVLKEMI